MTVHDDLATLRQARWLIEEPGPRRGESDAALSRVEAELARLEQERDEANRLRGIATEWAAELAGKKQAAEAEVARLKDGLRDWLTEHEGYSPIDADKILALLADQDGAA